MTHEKLAERKKSFIYEHADKVHGGTIPPVTLEIVARFTGDAGVRQAAEAVYIKDERPKLNGKDEWTNQPRRRRNNDNV